MRRMRAFLAGLMPGGLIGGFFVLTFLRVVDPSGASRLAAFLLGWLYGVGVLGLLRLFRVSPGVYPLVGLVCGPVPVALLLKSDTPDDQRGTLWLLAAVLGLLIGAVEWARIRQRAAAGA